MKLRYDINCDMGEGFGRYSVAKDEEIMPYITSCNLACGFHAGDPLIIRQTIKLARQYGVHVGAHPSFPDLQGFGRRHMSIPAQELMAMVAYQVSALEGMAALEGMSLNHVKAHGALYHVVCWEEEYAKALVSEMQLRKDRIPLMVQAGSTLESICVADNYPFISEVFVDRRYESDGKLRSRKYDDAIIHDEAKVKRQVQQMAEDHEVLCVDGQVIAIEPSSFCIHGDHENSLDIARVVHTYLSENDLLVR